MNPSPVSLESTRAAAASPRYGMQEAIQGVLEQGPEWLASIRPAYDGDWDQLLRTLKQRLPADPFTWKHRTLGLPLADGMQRANASMRLRVGLGLLHAGERIGADIFLQSLCCSDPDVREQALAQLRDLGRWDWHGGLPLEPKEVASAIAPLLSRPDDSHAESALHFCMAHAYEASRAQLAKRRASRDPKVFYPVLKAFMECDVDDGSFQVLEGHLLEPGIRASKDLVNRGSVVHDLCLLLMWWTDPRKKAGHRQRAAALALRVLQESLAAPDAPQRLAPEPDGWFYPEFLLGAVAAASPELAVPALRAVAIREDLDLRVRAQALALHRAAGGAMLPQRTAIVLGLLLHDWSSLSLSERLKQLVSQGLVNMRELAQAVGQPTWTHAATEAIRNWPRSPEDDALAIRALVEALGSFAPAFRERRHELGYIVQLLAGMPRTDAQEEAIRLALRQALQAAHAHPDEPWLAQEVQGFLVQCGAGAELDLATMNGWDAMHEHWRREGLDWKQVAQALVDAGAMAPIPADGLAAMQGKGIEGLSNLLEAGGRPGFAQLRDIGYEHPHDRLFAQLVAMLHPPVTLDAIAQVEDAELRPVPESEVPQEVRALGLPVLSTEGDLAKVVFHHEGRAFEFLAAPLGTMMDAWAVLHAFDLFMADLGRPERAFWIAAREDDDSWGLFAVAPAADFRVACRRLRIPLRTRPQ